MRDRLKLEWEVGLQRLPFFTQRLAVGLLGLLVVSLALVGGMVILWGGQQGSDVQLRPPPEAGQPNGPSRPGLVDPPAPVGGAAGHGDGPGVETGARGGEQVEAGDAAATQAPVAARVPAPPTTTMAGAASGQAPPRSASAGQQAQSTTTATPGGTPTTEPSTTTDDGGLLGPLPLPPVLTTLLR